MLVLTGNDVGPRGANQLAIVATFVTLGAIINANIFGELAVLVQALNRKSAHFQEQIDTANTAMKNLKLPEELQRRVQNYLIYTHSTLDNQQELDEFLGMISPSLKLEVTTHIFSVVILNNYMFKDAPEVVDFMVHKLVTLLYLPEDEIIR